MRKWPLTVSVCAGLCGAVLFALVYPDGSAPATSPEAQPEALSEIPSEAVAPPQPARAPDTAYRGPWKQAIATVFWVGEEANEDNGFIHNNSSAWDVNWETTFGGEDSSGDRCGYHPCAFTPEENPFYIALPYNDMRRGERRDNTYLIPWNDPDATYTLIKNRWVEVRAGAHSCFGQWEDVGPFESNDAAYVFGEAEYPANKKGKGAGIDLSPAMRDCLLVGDVAEVEWRHVDAEAVPEGPWTEIVTR